MTKYWVAATADGERPITVFTETYDAAIEHDLEQAPVGSLIHCVTDATPATEQERHYALALGVLTRHIAARQLAPITKIYETDSIPKASKLFGSADLSSRRPAPPSCLSSQSSNHSLQLTAGRRDDQLEFMKRIVDVVKARFRQR